MYQAPWAALCYALGTQHRVRREGNTQMQPLRNRTRRIITTLGWVVALVALCAVAGAPLYLGI